MICKQIRTFCNKLLFSIMPSYNIVSHMFYTANLMFFVFLFFFTIWKLLENWRSVTAELYQHVYGHILQPSQQHIVLAVKLMVLKTTFYIHNCTCLRLHTVQTFPQNVSGCGNITLTLMSAGRGDGGGVTVHGKKLPVKSSLRFNIFDNTA